MPMEFNELGDGLLAALSELDSQKRSTLLKNWKDQAVSTIGASLPRQLDEIVKTLTEVADKPDGWRPSDKWSKVSYSLLTNLFLQSTGRSKISEASSHVDDIDADSEDEGYGSGMERGPSPNDQRSNSLNSNNPA